MPANARVSLAAIAGADPLASYLSSVADGSAVPAEVIAVPIAVPTSDDSAPAEERPGSAGYQVGRDQRAAAAGASALDDYLPVGVVEILASSETTGRPGEITQAVARLGQATVTVLFLGVGDRAPAALRRAGAALGRRMRGRGTAVTTAVTGEPDAAVQAFVEGVLLGSYTFDMKSGDRDGEAPADINLLATDAGQADVLRRASVMAGAVALARDLGNTPSAVKSPAWLAARAAEIAGERGLDSRVWTEAELAAGGFGGLLAVGSGSARPPRLIQLSYRPQRAAAHVVLVGKGITFDSGGLSLKPNDNMKLMKTDMVGGAAVIAAMSALAELGVQVRVTGLIAAAENMPSGSALRIGDVICHFGGKTVEVLNTDAEGRLVLADALAYADASLDPDLVVDLATLTGAARVALGSVMAALYATDDGLAAALLEAGSASGDRLWRMPLADDYRDALESSVADLANVARGSGRAGSIDAALFLREFTGDRAWAHLDIAGAARATADDGENTKGATGFGTRLLLRWLTRDWPLAQ